MSNLPQITKQEYLQAISDGVTEAIYRDMPQSEEICIAITQAIRQVIGDNMLHTDYQKMAISDAVYNAMPSADQILEAIRAGVEDAA